MSGNKAERTYWVRWAEPTSIPSAHISKKWPIGMKGWLSGWSGDDLIYCARVDASSTDEAIATVRGCYGESANAISVEEPQEHELGWRPKSDRFPE